MQLVAYGSQDVVLTSQPEITFFKVVYRRHTNFAVEAIQQTFNGTVGYGKKVTCIVSRNGDLVTDCWLEITMKKDTARGAGTFFPAEALLREVKLEIGGQQIDKHYDDWFRVHDELFRSNDEKEQYRRLVDFVDGESTDSIKRFYVPLVFFFNSQPGLALPLIALQYHEVKIDIEFQTAENIPGVSAGTQPEASLFVDYLFLDVDERRRFAQSSHEYLLEQTQFTGEETVAPSVNGTTSYKPRLNFNHPVKYLAWVIKGQYHGQYTGWPMAGATGSNPIGHDAANLNTYAEALAPLHSAKLQLNGHDRFSERYGSYFNLVQPMQTIGCRPAAGIYLYSFALKPHEHQPSGTCNFSRIDNATLQLTLKEASYTDNVTVATRAGTPAANVKVESKTVTNAQNLTRLRIYARNYNILRIMSGMGGLAYAN